MPQPRLIKLSIHADQLTLYTNQNILPSLSFKFLNFPKIKLELFETATANKKCYDLGKRGVSVSEISSLVEDLNLNERGVMSEKRFGVESKKVYSFKNGKSCLFLEKIENLIGREDKTTDLYIILEDALRPENTSGILGLAKTDLSSLVKLATKNECEYNFSIKNLKIKNFSSNKSIGIVNFSVRLLIYDEVASELISKSLAEKKLAFTSGENPSETSGSSMNKQRSTENLQKLGLNIDRRPKSPPVKTFRVPSPRTEAIFQSKSRESISNLKKSASVRSLSRSVSPNELDRLVNDTSVRSVSREKLTLDSIDETGPTAGPAAYPRQSLSVPKEKNIPGYTTETESEFHEYIKPRVIQVDQPKPMRKSMRRPRKPLKNQVILRSNRSIKSTVPKAQKVAKAPKSGPRVLNSSLTHSVVNNSRTSRLGNSSGNSNFAKSKNTQNQKLTKKRSSSPGSKTSKRKASLNKSTNKKQVIAMTSTTGLKVKESRSNSEYINDGNPPSLIYTHKVQVSKNTKNRDSKNSVRSKSDNSIPEQTIPSTNRQSHRQSSTVAASKSLSRRSIYSQSHRPSIKIERVDPDLNVGHVVDTRNKGYKAASGKNIKNPVTGRLIIQMTKASRMRLNNARSRK